MPKVPVIVYDQNMQAQAFLQHAFNIGYEMPLNGLWSAQFSLPGNDPKTAECLPLRYVEIYDGDERIELFRILPHTHQHNSSGQIVTYQCEHVIATLLDDVMFQYHTIGNLGVYTTEVIEYILSLQTTERWQVGTIDFAHQFEYNWENEQLLGGLISVPKPFADEYMWSYDTTAYPWTVNLVDPPDVDDGLSYIRYGRNMQELTRTVNPADVCNRLYGLGYGEGVNQLNFADINSNVPYVEDVASQAQYGIVSRIFADTRFQSAETLKARCEAILSGSKSPKITYTAKGSDISRLTGTTADKYKTGFKTRIKDAELDEDIIVRIVNVKKSDVTGNPGEVDLTFANKTMDVTNTISQLQVRQRVHDTYAQGATNIDTYTFADNCDPTHPAIFRFYIPSEMVRINKVIISYRSEPFRAYSKAIEGGGGISTTSASGGGTTVSSASGGGAVPTSGPGFWTLVPAVGLAADFMNISGNHSHVATVGGVDGTTSTDGGHAHSMVSITHDHSVTIPSHTHDVTIPNHEHGIELPDHIHDIEYGIYEGPTPTEVTVTVDGEAVAGLGVDEDNVNLVGYLSKDSEGKIDRGTFHEIKITPNSLGRIVANVVVQLFVNSRGGGDF